MPAPGLNGEGWVAEGRVPRARAVMQRLVFRWGVNKLWLGVDVLPGLACTLTGVCGGLDAVVGRGREAEEDDVKVDVVSIVSGFRMPVDRKIIALYSV